MASKTIPWVGPGEAQVRGVGRYVMLVAQTVAWMCRRFPRAALLREQMFRLGVRSVPVVGITGAFTGMVIAVQSYWQLAQLGGESNIGALVILSMVKELGPVLTALMLAGRIGASMAAELGTMKVTEQVDALRALGGNPVQHLVVPRFVACVALTPALTVLADCVGIFGGWLVGVQLLGVDNHYFWWHAIRYVKTWEILFGILKGFVFGGIIATISCYMGLHAGQGADGVGRATTSANVFSCMVILVANFLLALIATSVYGMLAG